MEIPEYCYVLQPRGPWVGDGPPIAYDVLVFNDLDQGYWFRIDWQDGLMLYQNENIEPTHWPKIAAQLDLAMREARKLIGSTWIHGEFDDGR
jgi:hypothetical protein